MYAIRIIAIIGLYFAANACLAETHYQRFAEYKESDTVYIASLNLKQAPENFLDIYQMTGDQERGGTITGEHYSIRKFIRHLASWAFIGNKENNDYSKEVNSASIASINNYKTAMQKITGRRNLHAGDYISITLSNGTVKVKLNKQLVKSYKDTAFFAYMLNMWISPTAASPHIREQLTAKLNPEEFKQLSIVYHSFHANEAPKLGAIKSSAKKPQASQKTTAIKPVKKTTAATVKANTVVAAQPAKAKKATQQPTVKKNITAPKNTATITTPIKTAAATKTLASSTSIAAPAVATASSPQADNINAPTEQAAIDTSLAVDYKAMVLPANEVITQTKEKLKKQIAVQGNIDTTAINAITLYCTQQGEVIDAVSQNNRVDNLTAKNIRYAAKKISPIAISPAMQEEGIYAVELVL